MTSMITCLFLLNHVYPVLFQPGGYNSQLLPNDLPKEPRNSSTSALSGFAYITEAKLA